jgi:hypothetical protein
MAARLATDPELRQKYVEMGRRLSAARRRCRGCPLVTSPRALGSHQKATGHNGWEAVR